MAQDRRTPPDSMAQNRRTARGSMEGDLDPTSPEGRQARIFGAVLLEQRRVMEELAGPERFARVVAELPPDIRDEYEGLTMLSWCRHSTATTVTTHVGEAL